MLALTAQATAASPTTSSGVHTVGSLTVPGVDTGLVLKKGHSVMVTATGTVCPGTGYCTDPDLIGRRSRLALPSRSWSQTQLSTDYSAFVRADCFGAASLPGVDSVVSTAV